MKTAACYAFTFSAASALFAGCGGSQPPIIGQGATLQSSASATHAQRGGSWMLPEAKREDLLYVSASDGRLYVYSYPKHKLVGKISGLEPHVQGECVDTTGHIFVTAQSASGLTGTIYEFRRGGTKPIASLVDPGAPDDCSFDPTTGNLAVANPFDTSNPSDAGDVAVYTAAQGTPTIYSDPAIPSIKFCGYDNEGSLFVDDSNGDVAELAKGYSSFTDISIEGLTQDTTWIQWDGDYVTITVQDLKNGIETVNRIAVKGSSGDIVDSINLHGDKRFIGQNWIFGNVIAALDDNSNRIGFWKYPKGGVPIALDRSPKKTLLWGLTLSLASR
jgi:hypothetical protein